MLKEEHGEKLEEKIKTYEIYRKKKMIFTEKVTLLDSSWDKSLPYIFFRWEWADSGLIGVGIAKKLYAIQCSISYILGKTFKSIRNFAVPRVFLNKNSQPNYKELTNITGEVIEINNPEGKANPVFSTPPAMNEQVIRILEMLWQRAFEVIGISRLSAGGQIPRGLDKASGTALRSFQQIESERFQVIRSDYEQQYVEMTKKLVEFSSDSDLPKGIL